MKASKKIIPGKNFDTGDDDMKMPVIFAGHGSPMIALEDNDLTHAFRSLGDEVVRRLGAPKAILSLSAHWYTRGTFIQSEEHPRQIYDMYGFPKELYEVEYKPSGYRPLTDQVLSLLSHASINDDWGIDHGTWTVLTHMFPGAEIPVVQLSIDGAAGPKKAYEMGKLLTPLRESGYLILGSGNIVHNLYRLEWENENGSPAADRFDDFITTSVEKRADASVINYTTHPDASYAVPTDDHFLPLVYTLGASTGEKPRIYNNVRNLGSISMTGYAFGM